MTVWRWVQRYAPELERQLRRRLKQTNDSWRVDETYIRVKVKWVYLYRAGDSSGATIRNGLERLRSNLNDLANLPTKAFGLPTVEPPTIDEEFGALLLRPKFNIAFTEGWSPTIPWSLRFWPTFCGSTLAAEPPEEPVACVR